MSSGVSIPRRALFKPAEVCSLAGVQPYILRSWEAEFPSLGGKKGGPRVYRRADVELVLRIKELVFGEGLTLGAARRRIDAEKAPPEADPDDDTGLAGLFQADARERLAEVKDGLRSILAMLSKDGASPGGATGPEAVRLAEASGSERNPTDGVVTAKRPKTSAKRKSA